MKQHNAPRRLDFLDGLRGLACLQVVFLHVLSAYFPNFVERIGGADSIGSRIQDSPLFFIYDGYAGVLIFFFLSGYVLTRAFENTSARIVDVIQARIVRLWLPTIAFGLLSAVLYLLFRNSHVDLGTQIGSDFLRGCWRVNETVLGLLRDIFVAPLFTGYQHAPLAEAWPGLYSFADSGTALNSPVWTMSVELQGSMLVLAAVLLWQRAKVLWAAAAMLALVSLPGLLICFLAGHIAATARLAERRVPGGWPVGVLMLGVALAGAFAAWPHRNDDMSVPTTGVVFAGVILSEVCRRALAVPALQKLGGLSFTIYLIHWPIIFGPGAWLALHLSPVVGLFGARCAAAIVVLCAILTAAKHLAFVDRFTVRLSHRVRRGQDWTAGQPAGGIYPADVTVTRALTQRL